MKVNLDIRQLAWEKDIPLWQIAAQLNKSEATLIRWLRTPLSEEKRASILNAINELSKMEAS